MPEQRPEVSVIRTGSANLASVLAALRRAGASPTLTDDPDEIVRSPRVVLPGVGAFGAAITVLRTLGIVEPLAQRVAQGRPTLGICLGLQLFAERSDESPGVLGVGLVPARITRFDHAAGVRIPQFGFNLVSAPPNDPVLETGYAYFANSFKLDAAPEGWTAALSTHGSPFVAAMHHSAGRVVLCQFHPELSGAWGHRLISRWLDLSGAPC